MTLTLPWVTFAPLVGGCVLLLALIAWATFAPLDPPREPRAPRHREAPQPWRPLGLVTDGDRAVPDSRACAKGRCQHAAHAPRVTTGGRS